MHITPHNHCVHKTSPLKPIADCNTVGVLVYMPIYLIVDIEDYPNSTHIYSVVAATVDRKYCGYRNPCTPLVHMHIHMYVCTYCQDGQLRYTYIQYICYHTEG